MRNITLYLFNELTEEAQKIAVFNMRKSQDYHNSFYDYVKDGKEESIADYGFTNIEIVVPTNRSLWERINFNASIDLLYWLKKIKVPVDIDKNTLEESFKNDVFGQKIYNSIFFFSEKEQPKALLIILEQLKTKIAKTVLELTNELKSNIINDYKHHFSIEMIEDYCIINNVEFLKDGTIFNRGKSC